MREEISVVLSDPGCDHLLQPQERDLVWRWALLPVRGAGPVQSEETLNCNSTFGARKQDLWVCHFYTDLLLVSNVLIY